MSEGKTFLRGVFILGVVSTNETFEGENSCLFLNSSKMEK